MTTSEAAKQADVTEGAIKIAIRHGYLPAVKEAVPWRGRFRWQIRPEDFALWRQAVESRPLRALTVARRISDLRRAGIKINQIAETIGCNRRTVFRWLNRDHRMLDEDRSRTIQGSV